jgi:hypothetical protein
MNELATKLVIYSLLAIPAIGALLWLWSQPFGPLIVATLVIAFGGAFAFAERGP